MVVPIFSAVSAVLLAVNKRAAKSSEGTPWLQGRAKLWDENRTRNGVMRVANKKVPTRVSSSLTAANARMWPTVEETARKRTGKRINSSAGLPARRAAQPVAPISPIDRIFFIQLVNLIFYSSTHNVFVVQARTVTRPASIDLSPNLISFRYTRFWKVTMLSRAIFRSMLDRDFANRCRAPGTKKRSFVQ